MATPWPPAVPLPPLEPFQAGLLLAHAVDFVFHLSADGVILAANAAADRDMLTVGHWIGRPLVDVATEDSRGKVGPLLAEDAADVQSDARWRHLNFDTVDGRDVPLLLKHLRLGAPQGAVRLLIARDLRPMGAMQRQFQSVLRQIEVAAFGDAAPAPSGACPVGLPGGLGARIGTQPLDLIVAEVVRALERVCLREAMARTQGDRARAAALLGLSPDDFDRRILDADPEDA